MSEFNTGDVVYQWKHGDEGYDYTIVAHTRDSDAGEAIYDCRIQGGADDGRVVEIRETALSLKGTTP